MTVPHVALGKTHITVPALGIGIWSWGDWMFWGFGKQYQEADNLAAFQHIMKAGVAFFDTAEVYGLGQSEKMLGRFLKQGGHCAFIATKYFPFPFRPFPGSVRRALNGSLRRLGVSQIGLYQVHMPFSLMPAPVLMKAMASAVKDGLAQAVGVSNYDVEMTKTASRILESLGLPLASNQISYSLLHRQPERSGLVETCRELGVAVIAYSPLAQGLLSGRFTPENLPTDFRRNRFPKAYVEKIQPLLGLMREIGQAHDGGTCVQVALNWTIAKGAIPIPGAKNLKQAQDILAALEWQLTADEVMALDRASDSLSQGA